MKYIDTIHQQKHTSLFLFLLFSISCIFLRLIHLQIIHHKTLAHVGEKNFLRFKTIPAQRGNLLDCNGIPLATNQPITHLVWKGTGKSHLSKIQEDSIKKLEKILENPLSQRLIKHAEKFGKTVTIAQHITPQQLSLIAEQCSDTENIIFENSFERFYPHENLACHVIGYLSQAELTAEGKMGLEKILQDSLQGEPGIAIQYINSFGSQLNYKLLKEQSSGKDISTTIDINLQKIAEEVMSKHESGVFLLFDPITGAIPALVSLPNFNPEIFSKKINSEQWKELQEKRALINRAFNAAYPPASIFKLVTITAALEEHIITQDATFFCKGYTTFKDRPYYCNKHSGHGHITLQEALAYSCNIPCYKIAQKIHIDTLAKYAFEFGLGKKTDIVFTEKWGLIPTNEWKKACKGERWWMGETLSASIGQSFLLTTPIQIACMIGSIFHGYLVKPQILLNQEPIRTPINISKSTREFLQNSMESVISFGTGKRIKKLGNLTIFAKTGTAQTINKEQKKDSETKHNEHACFVSYFYTEKDSPLVMVILLEYTGGSVAATRIAKEFFIKYLKHKKELEKTQKKAVS